MPKSALMGLVLFFLAMPLGIFTTPPEVASYGINIFSAIGLIGIGIFFGRLFALPIHDEEANDLKDTFS